MRSLLLTAALVAFGSLALSGCVTKQNPAKTEVYYPGIGTVKHHCPPGHRKKGECY